MAKITPIDVIKGISGKYGGNSNDYFATNTSSNKIHLAKLANPYTGDPSEKQVAQRTKFANMQAAATAWLNANKASEANGTKGTTAYQYVEKLKRNLALSNIRQVLFKYMDEDYKITLPEGAEDTTEAEDTDSQSSGSQTSGGSTSTDTGSGTQDSEASDGTEKKTITATASPSNGGTISGGGEYAVGSSAVLVANANAGFTFKNWSDGDVNSSRIITVTDDLELTANFEADGVQDDGSFAG